VPWNTWPRVRIFLRTLRSKGRWNYSHSHALMIVGVLRSGSSFRLRYKRLVKVQKICSSRITGSLFSMMLCFLFGVQASCSMPWNICSLSFSSSRPMSIQALSPLSAASRHQSTSILHAEVSRQRLLSWLILLLEVASTCLQESSDWFRAVLAWACWTVPDRDSRWRWRSKASISCLWHLWLLQEDRGRRDPFGYARTATSVANSNYLTINLIA